MTISLPSRDRDTAYLDRRFEAVGRRFDEFRAELRGEIAATAAQTRRHVDVVAERLQSRIERVAEGVIAVDQKLDRVRAEAHQEFGKIDRRFLHLDARLFTSPR